MCFGASRAVLFIHQRKFILKRLLAAALFFSLIQTSIYSQDIRSDVSKRFEKLYEQMLDKPFIGGRLRETPSSPNHTSMLSRAYTCSKATYALANLYKNKDVGAANRHITEICEHYKRNKNDTSYIHDSNAWAGSLFVRLIMLFGSNSEYYPNRLNTQTEQQLLELMWDWANVHSEVAKTQYDQSKHWRIHESENHDAQRYMPMWGFALIFKEHPDFTDRIYRDGHSPAEHYQAWTKYFNQYLTERAKRGLFVEIATNFYSIHTIKGIYDMYDFSTDAALKNRAKMFLDLYFACFAQEQLDGVRGGSKSRLYQGTCRQYLSHDFIGTLGWYYFGLGSPEAINWDSLNVGYVGYICAATSSYRPHEIVREIALNPYEQVYEITERRMGLAEEGFYRNPDYRLPTDFGGILRYSYRTPEFIIGTSMLEARPLQDWTLISSQNRWHGVIFSGHPHARIYPECESTVGIRTYNEQWSVQKEGTLISQKLRTAEEAGDMRVWFARRGLENRIEEAGWVFYEAQGAYAAVKPVSGGYNWDIESNGEQRWLRCKDEYSPVIIEVAGKINFEDYAAFRAAVMSLELNFDGKMLEFASLSGNSFRFYADYTKMPEINRKKINLAPEMTFESPFVLEEWASGIVTIQNGDKRMELDFNKAF
jgi:hypothetical protein